MRDLSSGRRRTGERDLIDAGVGDQISAEFATPGDPIDDSRGKPRFLCRFGKDKTVEDGSRRGLEHDGAAGRQGGPEFHDGKDHRKIPRDYCTYDADGISTHQCRRAQWRGPSFLRTQPGCESCVIAKYADAVAALQLFGDRDRHAVLQAHRLGQLRRALLDGVGKSAERGASFSWGARSPRRPSKCAPCRVDCPVDVLIAPLGHTAEDFFGGRVDDLNTLRRGGLDPLAADK